MRKPESIRLMPLDDSHLYIYPHMTLKVLMVEHKHAVTQPSVCDTETNKTSEVVVVEKTPPSFQ